MSIKKTKCRCGDCVCFKQSPGAKFCGVCEYPLIPTLTHKNNIVPFCEGYTPKDNENDRK